MSTDEEKQRPFLYDTQVEPGEVRHINYEIGETYLGRPVELPITIINGEHPGPRLFVSAAIHGDEVNGVKVVQEVANRYNPAKLHGTIVCLHVLNVPGYIAEQRYIPIYDQDMNRAFPGSKHGSTASRMANVIYEHFISKCDMGLDFHTSTRNRMTVFHVRADMKDEGIQRLVDAFSPPLVLSGKGTSSMLRYVATEAGIPTLTVEMGEANRFQPLLIDLALQGIENVLEAYEMYPDAVPTRHEFRKVLTTDQEKSWIRADNGGIVEMKWGPHPVVEEGEAICAISNHFKTEEHIVTAPFTGFLVGILANPSVLPGHPLAHLVEVTDDEIEMIESLYNRVGFARHGTFHWMGKMGQEIFERVLESPDVQTD